jgi:hypothetical protein
VSQHYVDPKSIYVPRPIWASDINAQVNLLTLEGQLEPIIASRMAFSEDNYEGGEIQYNWVLDERSYDAYPYVGARIQAAIKLGWPTVLVETKVTTSG